MIKRSILLSNLRKSFKTDIRFCSKQRKFPINRQDAESLPIFEYPVASATDRRVYVWGFAETGALGYKYLPKDTQKMPASLVKSPKRLTFAEKHKVSDIACGYGFTVFAVKDPEVKLYGTGINTDSQLGYQTAKLDRPLEVLVVPGPIVLPISTDTQVVSVSAGRAHVLVLTDNEGAFSLGNNSYGQCGRPINDTEIYLGSKASPHPIPNVGAERITAVHCGQDHSLFVSNSGSVYSCGWGADGQTGLGHYRNVNEPTQVGGDIAGENIVKVAGVGDCVLALNDKGEVFGWGNTEYNQLLCNDDSQQLNVPKKLTNLRGLGSIADIAAGGSFCIVLNDQGDVYVWGYGLLGKGPELQRSFVPTQIPATLFGRNEFNPTSKVVSVACGMSHLAAINDQGDVYVWGRNHHACLGLGHIKDQYFPFKCAVGAKVLKVSCGVDHTVALCKPYI